MTNYLAPPKPVRITLVDVVLLAVPLTVMAVYLVTGPIMSGWNERRFGAAQSDGKMLGIAVIEYEQDHAGRLPPAANWEEALRPYLDVGMYGSLNAFLCPPTPYWEPPRRFAYNRAVGGKSLNGLDRPDKVVLFYESSLRGPDAADNLTHPAPTDSGGIVMVFPEGNHPDGSTEYVTRDRLDAIFQDSHQEETKLK